MSLPKSVTADTGMDVLTHAIESYVSNMASDYTDGLAEKASELVVTYLEQAYDDGTNKLAREKCIMQVQLLVWHLQTHF